VTVWATPAIPGLVTFGRALVSELNDLRYPATLHTIADINKYFSFIGNSDNRVQAAAYGWISDYPAASSFVLDTMMCSTFVPGSNQNENVAQLCDPVLDRRIQRATSVQTTNPAAASGLWAAIDRRITWDAPWVFIVNPSGLDFMSARVGNYQHNPQWGILLAQLWVK
jgi:peptide/nickel transport system substrate-binding protein